MRLGPGHRTWLAAALVGAAVLPPAVGWYVAGTREAARRGFELQERTRLRTEEALAAAASRLAVRLERLRLREDERPFFHYRTYGDDSTGVEDRWAMRRSPLAVGVSDPLVWAHFEVDTDGEVHLPSVNERFPELSADAGYDDMCRLLDELRTGLVMAPAGSGIDGELSTTTGAGSGGAMPDARIIEIEADLWRQIESGKPRGTSGSDRVAIRIDPLEWRTVVLASGPALAALRRVATPDGPIVQGLLVEPTAADEWLGLTGATFEPDAGPRLDRVAFAVGDTGWSLVIEMRQELELAAGEARRMRVEFRRRFAIVATGLALLSAAVIGLVAQADGLARQRARFAAAAAHELKTPLTSLRMHAEMLEEALPVGGKPQEWANRLAIEAARLGRVVTNMLDLTRLERGAPLAMPREDDAGDAIRSCLDRLRPGLESAGLELEVGIPSELPRIVVDRDALCQILNNLTDNAEAATRSCDTRRVRVDVTSDRRSVLVRVADSGPGVAPEVHRGLFDPFRRADAAGTGGLGLGLAIARALARAMGGDLALADGDGGATFVLTLAAIE